MWQKPSGRSFPQKRKRETPDWFQLKLMLLRPGRPSRGLQLVAGLSPPAEPAECIVQRANLAAFLPINNLNGNELDPVLGQAKLAEQFGLDFEVGGANVQGSPGIEVHQAKSILRIRQISANQLG